MTKLRFLFFPLLLAAACASAPTATPTPLPTDTPLPTATRTPAPTRTPTQEAVSPEVSEQLEAVHMSLFLIQVEAEIVTEAAVRTESGELDSAGLLGVLENLSTITQTVDQVAAGVQVPDEVAPAWEEALDAHAAIKDLLGQWLDDQIAPVDVITQMEPVRQAADEAMDVGWQSIARLLRVDAAGIEAAREDALAEIVEEAFVPPPVVYACGEGETEEAVASLTGRIAFVSDRDGDPEIYVVNAGGSGATRLTESPGGDYAPSWSPDGTQIAFYSERDGNAEIYIMNADGSELTRLTNHTANDYDPSWSPDGTRIAFHTHRFHENPMVAVMNADGSDVVQLTPIDIGGWSPSWSPDGSQIVFNSARGIDRDIWLMSAEGTGIVNLTNGRGDDWWPEWSPAGGQIVFHSERDGDFEIYVMTTAGEAVTRLTHNPALDYNPGWSPDGTRIVFTSDGAGNRELCAMNADGSGLFNITSHPANDWASDWGP